MMKQFTILCFALFHGLCSLNAQWSINGDTTVKKAPWNLLQKFSEEEWNANNFASEEEMQWFNDARYGMFIHFGLSTYIGSDLSWGMCYTRKAPDKGHGPIADSVWIKYPEQFVFPEFNAKEWVDIAIRAGMKYIVVIAKHHDGFHLWDTRFSKFKVTNTPFGRDFLKELADACHDVGMKFGIYYSQRDWYHPDYAPVDTSLIDVQDEAPFFRPKPGVSKVMGGATHQKYIDYQFNVVRELCTNYGKVDIFWFDALWWGGMFTAEMWDSERLTQMIRALQPGIIVNNRASLPGDFDTPEQKLGEYQLRPWESCITLCHTWSWSDTPVKSKKQIIEILTSTACGNGNLLLSWGPKWEGSFDPKQMKRLEEVGKWLKKYGNAFYNTRGGPWYPEKWGGSTYIGNKVYVHVVKGTTPKELVLPPIENKIIEATALTGGEIGFSQDKSGVNLNLQNVDTNVESIIVELIFQSKIKEMVGEKMVRGKFSDPVYGEIISKNSTLELSSTSKFNNPQHLNLIFGNKLFNSPFAFHTKPEKQPHAIIDLGKTYSVTGVDIYNEKGYKEGYPGIFEVQISTNRKDWKTVEQKEHSLGHWEVTVAQFSAGMQLPGVNARFLKILLNAEGKQALHLKKVFVYGKK